MNALRMACAALILHGAPLSAAVHAARARVAPPARFALPSSAIGAAALQGPALGSLSAPSLSGVVPAPTVVPTFGELTGAAARVVEDRGPVKRMWLVYQTDEELADVQEALSKIKAANPGVEVFVYRDDLVIPRAKSEKPGYDASGEARQAVFDRLLREGCEFVLGTNQDVYEYFRGLRDANLARQIPMGFAGRNYVSVDMPRASLDPAALSEPSQYPAKRYLWLSDKESAPAKAIAGMEGIRKSLEGASSADAVSGHDSSKGDEDMGFFTRLGTKLMMKLAGQSDPKETARLREKAHHLAAYLEHEKVDVIATDDPEATKVLALMKSMGYHKSLPVVWASREAPADASALNLAVVPAPWQKDAPHVAVSPTPSVSDALAAAPKLARIPQNFMEMGGVSVRDFEPTVASAIDRALPGAQPGKGRFDVHFLLTNGNGVRRKGDANAFGHFGMAVSDEKGKVNVWTVQYNDGGSFTGGLGEGKQLSLAEYLYTLWYLPGAVGQAIPLAETAVAPVFDFILRGVDEAQVEAMRRKAAEINARHLRGKDDYRFLNQSGMTNCISLVTQILRAAGFRIPETGIQDPAGQAFNMVAEFSRWMLSGRLAPEDFGLVVFDRPKHAGPEHYRIASTAMASPLFSRGKPWQKMSLWEKIKRALSLPWNMAAAMKVPSFLEAFASMASHRVTVGPNSRTAVVSENAESPILRLRASRALVTQLRGQRVGLMERLSKVEERIIKAIGFEGWAPNPAQTLEEQARERQKSLDEAAQKALEADLAAHHRATIELSVNRIDEQIELRRIDFLTILLVDPEQKHADSLAPLRQGYEKVLAYRDAVVMQDRVLTDAEIDELDELNARIETELEAVRLSLLKEAGPAVPQSIKMILGQVSRETLEELRRIGEDGPSGKGKGEKSK